MTPEEQEEADLYAAMALVCKHYPNVVIVYSSQTSNGFFISEQAHITQTLGAVAYAQHSLLTAAYEKPKSVGTPQA